jgi:hypothetical protein
MAVGLYVVRKRGSNSFQSIIRLGSRGGILNGLAAFHLNDVTICTCSPERVLHETLSHRRVTSINIPERIFVVSQRDRLPNPRVHSF